MYVCDTLCMYVRLSRYQCMYVRLTLCEIHSYVHTLFGESIWSGYAMGLGTHCGVAAISKLLKMIGLFCRISSLLQGLLANHGRTSRMYVEKTSLTAHVNQSCLMCEWVMSHAWMNHVAHMDEASHKYEWVISKWVVWHVWISQVSSMNESCRTYEWVMS